MAATRFDRATFPPAPREPPLVQSVLLQRDPLGYSRKLRRRLGPVFTLRAMNSGGYVCATSPDANKAILTDQTRFSGGGDATRFLAPVVGEGSLICTPPPRHLRNRKLLLPPFHGERIAGWGRRVGELIDARLPELIGSHPPQTVAVRPWAQALTLDVILRVVFGLEEPRRVDQFRTTLTRFMDSPSLAVLFLPEPVRRDLGPLSPGGAFARRRAEVDALIREEIAARREAPDRAERDDVLSVLLGARHDDGTGFSDAELRDELMGLLLAGHETTATALAWALHLLAHHPAIRDELIAELDRGDTALLKATIKEAMRLRPPVFDAVRTAVADTEIDGRPVPAGATVMAMFTVTHLDPELWDAPQAFRPQRHLDGTPAPYALTPFGGGVRRCIGAALAQLELEVALQEVLARAVPQPAGPPEPGRLFTVTVIPAKGGRVRFDARSPAGPARAPAAAIPA